MKRLPETIVAALALLIALPLLAPSAQAQEQPDLTLLNAKMKFRGGDRGRDSVKLRILFRSEFLPSGFDATAEPLEVRVGPETIISLPAGGDAGTFRAKDAWRSVYREKRSQGRTGVRKLKLDLASGHLTLRAKRLDLSALRDAGPDGVAVTVVLGDEEFAGTVDFSGRAKAWKFRAPRNRVVVRPPVGGGGGGGGGGSGGGGSGAALSVRILHSGYAPPAVGATTMVARDLASYGTLWSTFVPPMPPGVGAPDMVPPSVDFTREIVVAVGLGMRPTGGYSVTVLKATQQGTGALATWEETKPGPNCVVTQALTHPFVIAAITRVEGTVTFTGQSKTLNCGTVNPK